MRVRLVVLGVLGAGVQRESVGDFNTWHGYNHRALA